MKGHTRQSTLLLGLRVLAYLVPAMQATHVAKHGTTNRDLAIFLVLFFTLLLGESNNIRERVGGRGLEVV